MSNVENVKHNFGWLETSTFVILDVGKLSVLSTKTLSHLKMWNTISVDGK